MVQRHSLAQRLGKMQNVYNVHTIWFVKHKDFIDVLEHDFVVVGLSVQLREVWVKIKRVVATWNDHWQVLDRRHDFSGEFSDVSFLVNFLIKQLCSRHVVIVFGAFFVLSLLLLLLSSSALFLGFLCCASLLTLFLIQVELVVGDMEAHFAKNVAITDLISTKGKEHVRLRAKCKLTLRHLKRIPRQPRFCRLRLKELYPCI